MTAWSFGLAMARILAASIPLVLHPELRVSTVSVGGTPWGVAVNPATHEVYVAESFAPGGALDVLDQVGRLLKRFSPIRSPVPAPAYSYTVVVDPIRNRAYVLNVKLYEGSVTSVDRSNEEIVESDVGESPTGLAIHFGANRVYVGHGYFPHSGVASATVTVLDGESHSTRLIRTGIHPVALTVDESHGRLYVANQGDTINASDTATVVEVESEETRTVTVGTTPFAIAVDPRRDRAWVVNAAAPTLLAAIEAGRGYSVRSIPLGAWGVPAAVAVNPTTDVVFVALQSAPWMLAVQGETLKVRQVPIGKPATRLAVDTIHDRIYALQLGPSDDSPGVLTVIDGASFDSKTVAVGRAPRVLAVDPDFATAYVSNGGDGTVTVVEAVCFRCPRAIPVRGHVAATGTGISDAGTASENARPAAPRRPTDRPSASRRAAARRCPRG
jgi:DNA-binding beta-propeller fold protein YncE